MTSIMERSENRRNRIGGQMAGLYDLEETIGEGHYAVVKMARHVFTGEKVAVKVIDKMKLDAATRLQMMQEVRLMKLVQHPYVVRLYEVIDTQTKLYLVLEFADGGDMYDYIMKHEGGLDEHTAKKYFRQIVTAIQYCHKLHVVHRDLKPENVVFFEKLGMVKLTDFGFSNKFDPGQRLQTSCGSLAYSAPEILLGDSYDAPAVGKTYPHTFFMDTILLSTLVAWVTNCMVWWSSLLVWRVNTKIDCCLSRSHYTIC